MQEETTYLGIPCFTLRDNTERPVTCSLGTNVLLGLAPDRITEVPELICQARTGADVPPGWDGAAAERLVDVLLKSDLGGDRDLAPAIGDVFRERPRAETVTPPESSIAPAGPAAEAAGAAAGFLGRPRARIGGVRTPTTACISLGRRG